MWVAGGDDVLGYSYDGINWLVGSVNNLSEVYSIVWNGSRWYCTVRISISIEETYLDLLYSEDGINWNPSESSNSFKNLASNVPDHCSIAWNGSMFVVTFEANMGYSYDGLNWSTSNNGDIVSSITVSWNGQYWIAGGDNGTNQLAYSVDGINWNLVIIDANLIGAGNSCRCIANRSILPNVGQNLHSLVSQSYRSATVKLSIGDHETVTDITLSVVKTGKLVCMNISSFLMNTGGPTTDNYFVIPWADCTPVANATYIQITSNVDTPLLLRFDGQNVSYININLGFEINVNTTTVNNFITYFTA